MIQSLLLQVLRRLFEFVVFRWDVVGIYGMAKEILIAQTRSLERKYILRIYRFSRSGGYPGQNSPVKSIKNPFQDQEVSRRKCNQHSSRKSKLRLLVSKSVEENNLAHNVLATTTFWRICSDFVDFSHELNYLNPDQSWRILRYPGSVPFPPELPFS